MSEIIRTRELTKIYHLGKTEIRALDRVNLRIMEGEFLGVFGPSGSGKSTLLNMIGALDRPTSGEVFLSGEKIENLSDPELSRIRRERVGFIFQTFNLLPSLTAIENVAVPLLPVERDRSKLYGRSRELLAQVGLSKRIHHKPAELSGGERQRVAIARALLNNPSIILADEPTGNLDSKTGEEIISLMKELNKEQKKTFVIVSHNPAISRMVDRIIYLKDGRIMDGER
jgi:putative ABC transport system ATP-binding protein